MDYCVITLKRSKSNYQHPTPGVWRERTITCTERLLSKQIPLGGVSQQAGSKEALMSLRGQALPRRALLLTPWLWPGSSSGTNLVLSSSFCATPTPRSCRPAMTGSCSYSQTQWGKGSAHVTLSPPGEHVASAGHHGE